MFKAIAAMIFLSLSACSPILGQDAPDNLQRYVACEFGAKTKVEEKVERTDTFLRPVDAKKSDSTVKVVHAFSLHIAYDGVPFVNFKAERLDWSNYQHDRQTLLQQLTEFTNTPDMESPKPQHTSLNGFELYGISRKQLEGGVLSMYLVFRDIDHTVVTLYFLNTPPEDPKFHTIEQAHKLRDDFLAAYTSCVDNNLRRQ